MIIRFGMLNQNTNDTQTQLAYTNENDELYRVMYTVKLHMMRAKCEIWAKPCRAV